MAVRRNITVTELANQKYAYVTISEAAEIFDRDPKTVRRWIDNGTIPEHAIVTDLSGRQNIRTDWLMEQEVPKAKLEAARSAREQYRSSQYRR